MAFDLCTVSVFVVESIPGELAARDGECYHSRDCQDFFVADF
jgi:hypothetical protein